MATTVDQKLRNQTKYPPEFKKKVDTKKINIEVIKKWASGRITEILGKEDDVVISYCNNLLERSRYPDIRDVHIQLTGFLERDALAFCKELWDLCLSAQESPQGVPQKLLEEKKLELLQEKLQADKEAEAKRKREDEDMRRKKNLDEIRWRENKERNRKWSGYRSDSDRDYAPRQRPPPEEDRRGPSKRSQRADTYTPADRRANYERRARSRSRSPARNRRASRSTTPPTYRSNRLSPRRDRGGHSTSPGRGRGMHGRGSGVQRRRNESRDKSPSGRTGPASPRRQSRRRQPRSPSEKPGKKRRYSSEGSSRSSESPKRRRSRRSSEDRGQLTPPRRHQDRMSEGSFSSRRSSGRSASDDTGSPSSPRRRNTSSPLSP